MAETPGMSVLEVAFTRKKLLSIEKDLPEYTNFLFFFFFFPKLKCKKRNCLEERYSTKSLSDFYNVPWLLSGWLQIMEVPITLESQQKSQVVSSDVFMTIICYVFTIVVFHNKDF